MIITMKKSASNNDISSVIEFARSYGVNASATLSEGTVIIIASDDSDMLKNKNLELLNGVERVINTKEEYPLASRSHKKENTVINANGIHIGDGFVIMAGPCAVEGYDMLLDSALTVKKAGADILRCGAYKPRTSPYAFQGLQSEGFRIIAEVREKASIPVISEVISSDVLKEAEPAIDIIQIGSRNMQNFELLKAVGRSKLPVLLKRGMAATIDEWLNAAEYIMNEGNENVILCERGIRTFENSTRSTLDISAVPVIKERSHLPVIVDPSHAAGTKKYVPALSLAAAAAGSDGLLLEMHPCPPEALSDAQQALDPLEFNALCKKLGPYIRLLKEEF